MQLGFKYLFKHYIKCIFSFYIQHVCCELLSDLCGATCTTAKPVHVYSFYFTSSYIAMYIFLLFGRICWLNKQKSSLSSYRRWLHSSLFLIRFTTFFNVVPFLPLTNPRAVGFASIGRGCQEFSWLFTSI